MSNELLTKQVTSVLKDYDNAKKTEGNKLTDNYFTTYNGKEENRNIYDLFSSATLE